jgi:hypothetical protein
LFDLPRTIIRFDLLNKISFKHVLRTTNVTDDPIGKDETGKGEDICHDEEDRRDAVQLLHRSLDCLIEQSKYGFARNTLSFRLQTLIYYQCTLDGSPLSASLPELIVKWINGGREADG